VTAPGQHGLSYLVGKLGPMARPKRQPSPKTRRGQPDRRHQAPETKPPDLAQRVPRMSPAEVLERIGRTRTTQQETEAELAVLVDRAVGLGIGWPEIAAEVGVTRQAARQHYQRRHRDDASRQGRIA
jgi:hypothetical protein